MSLGGEVAVLSTLAGPPRRTHQPRPATLSAIKQLSTASSELMPGRIQQGPASGCQRVARGKEAAEPRAEDQAGGATVPLQL